MKIWILVLSFCVNSVALAEPCFRSEVNPVTRKIYASAEVYEQALRQWESQKPEVPGLFSLARAYAVYSQEKDFANSFKRDKRAHCYIGCRITQETDYRVAEYVGWLKEHRDIRDCKKGTHFDAVDFVATVKGAQFGQSQPDAAACLQVCQQNY